MEENKNGNKHFYDGIEEQNNPMPDWWVWLFIFCVIFSFIYWLHYVSGSGPTLQQEYAEALQKYHENVEKNTVPVTETEDSLTAYMKSEMAIQEGAGLFAAKCAICHGAQLEGKIGPNLTDRFWTTGNGSRMNIVQTIKEGSPAKGMPPWEAQLKPNEIKSVAAFVYAKIGSNPGNAKAPEGTEVK
jgi:cytochrome c oxidase cbb3-type subunit III